MAEDTKPEFPAIQPGASLILAWQIKDKHVLVVGGGEVAAGRILNVLDASARVTVICPASGLNPEVRHRINSKAVTHIDRLFLATDLDDPSIAMVLTAVDDPAASTTIWKLCKERRIPANIADVPPECDFYFGSIHRDGPLQIMVSTNGKGPRLSNFVRRTVAGALPPHIGDAIENTGKLRMRLRGVAPDIKEGPKRMKWMIRVSDTYSLEELRGMTEQEMDLLLSFFKYNKVPRYRCLRAILDEFPSGYTAQEFYGEDPVPRFGCPDAIAKKEVPAFEGSFGFCVGC